MSKKFNLIVYFLLLSIGNTFADTDFMQLYNQLSRAKLHAPTPTSDIAPGVGYATDTQSTAPIACYTPVNISTSGISSILSLDQSVSKDALINALNLTGYVNSGYGTFATDGILGYVKNIQDTNYSLAFNYYEKISEWVNVDYNYSGDILNSAGNDVYSNGTDPLFRLLCGDRLITSYESGAEIIITLQVNFSDRNAKNILNSNISGKNSNLVDILATINSIASANKLNGSVSIHAIQLGGDPRTLSKILSTNIVTCSINDTKSCTDAANHIINYMKLGFPLEIMVEKDRFVPLGGLNDSIAVSDIGIKLSPSYVSKDVADIRTQFITKAQKLNEYYLGFNDILNNYPVALDDSFQHNLSNTVNAIKNNLHVLADSSPTICWLNPMQCSDLQAQVQNNWQALHVPLQFSDRFQQVIKSTSDMGFKSIFWPTGFSQDIDLTHMYGYSAYLPPEQRNGFYLITSTNAYLLQDSIKSPLNKTFHATGIYHDGGSCPFDAQYTINNGNLQYFTVNPGGCGNPQRYVTIPYDIEMEANPFYFTVDNEL